MSPALQALTQILTAAITAAGMIAAAVISVRHTATRAAAAATANANGVISTGFARSLWLGIIACILWLVPLLGYLAAIPGLYLAVRERAAGRKHACAGLLLCALGLAAALASAAYGADHGTNGLWGVLFT